MQNTRFRSASKKGNDKHAWISCRSPAVLLPHHCLMRPNTSSPPEVGLSERRQYCCGVANRCAPYLCQRCQCASLLLLGHFTPLFSSRVVLPSSSQKFGRRRPSCRTSSAAPGGRRAARRSTSCDVRTSCASVELACRTTEGRGRCQRQRQRKFLLRWWRNSIHPVSMTIPAEKDRSTTEEDTTIAPFAVGRIEIICAKKEVQGSEDFSTRNNATTAVSPHYILTTRRSR